MYMSISPIALSKNEAMPSYMTRNYCIISRQRSQKFLHLLPEQFNFWRFQSSCSIFLCGRTAADLLSFRRYLMLVFGVGASPYRNDVRRRQPFDRGHLHRLPAGTQSRLRGSGEGSQAGSR